MRIRDVLKHKGDQVVTIAPWESVRGLLNLLATHRVGALVVSSAPGELVGIVSERDIVRHLASDGVGILDGPVSAIMTTEVHTASREDTVDDLMGMMTSQRVRHLPVIEDGRMIGIVSIGDLVNHCVMELRAERDQLTAYITN